jgi:4-aminobutyrate aminotransferase-like enzyme
MGHPIAFDFTAVLAKIAPACLDRIFLTNSGSESVDTALKIALAHAAVLLAMTAGFARSKLIYGPDVRTDRCTHARIRAGSAFNSSRWRLAPPPWAPARRS